MSATAGHIHFCNGNSTLHYASMLVDYIQNNFGYNLTCVIEHYIISVMIRESLQIKHHDLSITLFQHKLKLLILDILGVNKTRLKAPYSF